MTVDISTKTDPDKLFHENDTTYNCRYLDTLTAVMAKLGDDPTTERHDRMGG